MFDIERRPLSSFDLVRPVSPLSVLAGKIQNSDEAFSLIRRAFDSQEIIEHERQETERYRISVDLEKQEDDNQTSLEIARVNADRDISVASIGASRDIEVTKTNAAASVLMTAIQCGALRTGNSEIQYEESRSRWSGNRKWTVRAR